MKKDRREFLKTSCGALSMAALATQMRHFGMVSALAQDKADVKSADGVENYKALVCVFLVGGNDSNNSIVPNYDEGYALYAAARQAQGLAISRSSLLPVTPPTMGGQIYGFNPNLSGLHTLWQQNKLAVVTNVGTLMQPLTRAQYLAGAARPLQLFSHPDQEDQFKTVISNYRASVGWGGRLADKMAGQNVGAAIPMISQISGAASVYTIGNQSAPLIVSSAPTPLNQVLTLNGFGSAADETARRTAMNNIRQSDLDYTMVQSAASLTQQAINVSQQLSTDPLLTVTFPNSTLGNQLKQVAKLMKFRTELNMKRQIFYVQLGGFDHHSSQLSPHASLLTQVSQALKAFYDETVAQGISENVTTFTMSDFNRTLNPAGSGSGVGSDHGWGGHHFVIGGAVRGGDFYGKPTSNGTIFPTLVTSGPDDADSRGRIIPTVAVEQYASTLARWFGLAPADLPLVFPNINSFSGTDLGFLM